MFWRETLFLAGEIWREEWNQKIQKIFHRFLFLNEGSVTRDVTSAPPAIFVSLIASSCRRSLSCHEQRTFGAKEVAMSAMAKKVGSSSKRRHSLSSPRELSITFKIISTQ